jgi:putative membrane protein
MRKILEIVLVTTTGWPVSCAAEGMYGPQGAGGWGSMMHNGFGYGGMYMWLIFLIVVGVIVYFYVQNQKTKDPLPRPHETPLDILKRRYAEGDITQEEYEKMKIDLDG